MHKLYCIIGRTASGKSTITRLAAKKMKMNVLKSYTTRKPRKGETTKNSDHTFILPEDVDSYRDDMVAYTERVGYCSFATKQQIMNSDFYIINPSGYFELKLKTKNMDVELIPIYITVPYRTLEKRARNRGEFNTWRENYIKESEEFTDFEKSNLIDYRILNDGDLEFSVDKLINIIRKDNQKDEEK